MNQFTIGDLCDVVKGNTGIKKAISGEFPLVVTAQERLTHNIYQFDAKAVCIPLVSSTGHGHASISRIHYQTGKFALGTILAAVIPKDEATLKAEYLYIYLLYFKDSILVPLMKGGVNVSLSIDKIKTVKILVPSVEKQIELIKISNSLTEIEEALKQSQGEAKLLMQSVMQKTFQTQESGE